MAMTSCFHFQYHGRAFLMLAFIFMALCNLVSSAPSGQDSSAPPHVSLSDAFKRILKESTSQNMNNPDLIQQLRDQYDSFRIAYDANITKTLYHDFAEYRHLDSSGDIPLRSSPIVNMIEDLHVYHRAHMELLTEIMDAMRLKESWSDLGEHLSTAAHCLEEINDSRKELSSRLRSQARYHDPAIVSFVQTTYRKQVDSGIEFISGQVNRIYEMKYSKSEMNLVHNTLGLRSKSLADLVKSAEQKMTKGNSSPEPFVAVDPLEKTGGELAELAALSRELRVATLELNYHREVWYMTRNKVSNALSRITALECNDEELDVTLSQEQESTETAAKFLKRAGQWKITLEQHPSGLSKSPYEILFDFDELTSELKLWHQRLEKVRVLREMPALQKKLAQLLHEITMAKYSPHQLGMRLNEFDDQGSSGVYSDPEELDTAAALIQEGRKWVEVDYNSAYQRVHPYYIAKVIKGLCRDLEVCRGALEKRSKQSTEIVGQLKELYRSISTATMNQHTGEIEIDRQRPQTAGEFLERFSNRLEADSFFAGPLSSNLNVREATLEDLTNLLENAKSCQELLKNPARIREETAASQKEILELLSEIKMASEAKQQKPAVAHAAVKLREEMVGKWGTYKHYADRSQDIVSVSREWRESYDDLDRLRRLLSVLREGEAECCFCAQPMHIEATTLPCDHKCHIRCIDQWTSQKNQEDQAATCPLCRREIEHLEPA